MSKKPCKSCPQNKCKKCPVLDSFESLTVDQLAHLVSESVKNLHIVDSMWIHDQVTGEIVKVKLEK